MSQYEQENFLGGGGGGEVDEETHAQAWRDADARRGREDAAAEMDTGDEHGDEHGDEQS
jgi:hypothetical protein